MDATEMAGRATLSSSMWIAANKTPSRKSVDKDKKEAGVPKDPISVGQVGTDTS